MLQHLLKSLWRRKGKNAMISIEIMLIFVVIFAVVVGFAHNLGLYNKERGFDVQDRWRVRLATKTDVLDRANPDFGEHFRRVVLAMPEVKALSFIQSEPYNDASFAGQFRSLDSSRFVDADFLQADDAAQSVLNLPLRAGRWFLPQDEATNEPAAVINRRMAVQLFGDENPLGKRISNSSLKNASPKVYKVLGVIDDYRYRGEFMNPDSLVIIRHSAIKDPPLSNFVIHVKAGTPRQFEIKLHQQLRSIRHDVEYDIVLLDEARNEMLRQKKMFFLPPVLIAGFLLVMVSFGLFGVLWQNVHRRIPEIGLRRAVGASSSQIYVQIVTEQVLLSTIAMAVGLLFLVQLPLTGVFAKFMNWESFLVSAAVAMALVYVMSIVCALYPAWMASRMNPTDALHAE